MTGLCLVLPVQRGTWGWWAFPVCFLHLMVAVEGTAEGEGWNGLGGSLRQTAEGTGLEIWPQEPDSIRGKP